MKKMSKLASVLLATGVMASTVQMPSALANDNERKEIKTTEDKYIDNKSKENYFKALKNAKEIDNNKISTTQVTKNDNVTKAIGLLKVHDDNGKRHGTAFVVGRHTIITNHHVVRDKLDGSKLVQTKDMLFKLNGKDYKINSIKPLFLEDVAILHTKTPIESSVKPLKIAKSSAIKHLNKGETLHSYGYPDYKTLNNTIDNNALVKINGYYLNPKTIFNHQYYMKMKVRRGASGSPILNKNNEIVGIVKGGYNRDGKMRKNASKVELSSAQNLNDFVRSAIINEIN